MTEQQNNQYQTIIQARNFHYEQFTRWSSYFYVVIGALFAGYYFIMKENPTNTQETNVLSWVILGIGYLTSVANFLSVKGYIYWWQHWNIFLNHFEQKVCTKEEKVYSVFADKQELDKPCSRVEGCNISTSKVALLMARVIVLGWCILFGYKAWLSIPICNCCGLLVMSIVISLLLYLVGIYGIPNCNKLRSNISKHTDLGLLKDKK